MGLWYKAWVESRVRFLLAAAVIGIVSAGSVLWHDAIHAYLAQSRPIDGYTAYIYRVSYQGSARTLFLTFAVILGLGGLLRERELGTAAFTLGLPVSRMRLTMVRAATGLLQVVALTCLPALLIVSLSPLVNEAYPAMQAVQFSLMWSAGGAALFGVAFLASTLFSGEYTPFVVAEMVHFGHTVGTQFIRLARPVTRPYLFTVQDVMSGWPAALLDPATRLIVGPFPIVPVILLLAATCLCLACAVRCTAVRDF